MIRAIETHYRGFRSRTEARYATMFDSLGLPYVYEEEGYVLGMVGWYLPDFHFPTLQCWGEVKPGIFTLKEYARAQALGRTLLLDGPPTARYYFCASRQAPYATYRDQDASACLVDLVRSVQAGRLWYGGQGARCDQRLAALEPAVTAARSARFEHGEHPHSKERTR